MPQTQRSLSTGAAVAVGTLLVNVPVFALLFGPALAATNLDRDELLLWVLPLSFGAAWAWWSFSVSRWRLWAYERVTSTGELKEKAIAAGLVWPQGSFFERTEFKTPEQRRRQQELERKFP